MSTLAKALSARTEEAKSVIPEDVQVIMNEATDELTRSDIINQTLKVGQRAPNFELKNAVGERVKLSKLLEDGPVVLSFYRGGWCPYCNIELAALQKIQPELNELQSRLVAISPQTPDASLSTKEKNELSFEVLSDPGNGVSREFGLVFKLNEDLKGVYNKFGLDLEAANGDDAWELPLPATYVITPDRTVQYAFVNTDYKQRAEPAEIIQTLKALPPSG